jgi:hypothetical protein
VAKNEDDTTTPLNDPVSKTAEKHVTPALQGNNDPVVNLTKTAVNNADNANSLTTPFNDPVRQVGLGRLICEECGVNVIKKAWNQRFCSTECRVKSWEKSTGGKVLKKKVAG